MELYKENIEYSFLEENIDNRDQEPEFDPRNPKFSENTPSNSFLCDFVPAFEELLKAIESNNHETIKYLIERIADGIRSFRPNNRTFDYLIHSNILSSLFKLLSNPISPEIYQLSLWLITVILSKSEMLDVSEVSKIFESLNLMDFLFNLFIPNYKKLLDEKVEQLPKMNLNDFHMNLLPYYLHLLAFCCRNNENIQDQIIQIIIYPNLDIFFDDFYEEDRIIEATYLILNSTNFSLTPNHTNYVNQIIVLFLQNWEKMPKKAQKYLLQFILNLVQFKDFVQCLFKYHFESFLFKYMDQRDKKDVDDYVLNVAIQIQLILLKVEPRRIDINYTRLIDVIVEHKDSREYLFGLFDSALNLKKDSPFGNDEFFKKFMYSIENESFDVKIGLVGIINCWISNSTQSAIMKRASVILVKILELINLVSLKDPSNLLILREILVFFDVASKSSKNDLDDLKNAFATNDGISTLEGILKDEESPLENSSLASKILNDYFS